MFRISASETYTGRKSRKYHSDITWQRIVENFIKFYPDAAIFITDKLWIKRQFALTLSCHCPCFQSRNSKNHSDRKQNNASRHRKCNSHLYIYIYTLKISITTTFWCNTWMHVELLHNHGNWVTCIILNCEDSQIFQ